MKIKRAGLALQPGENAGDLLVWDGIRWGPAPPPSLPAPIPPAPGTITNNTTIVYVDGNPVPSSQLSPLTLACVGRWEADHGILVADGAPIDNWASADGTNVLTAGGVAVRMPIFHAQDNGDNIPYVSFNGVLNEQTLDCIVPGAAYVGTDITVYLVIRPLPFVGGGPGDGDCAFAYTRPGVAGIAAGTLALRRQGTRTLFARYDNVSNEDGSLYAADQGSESIWQTVAIRINSVDAVKYHGLWRSGLGGKAMRFASSAFNVDRINLGADRSGNGNYFCCHVRHLSVYQTAHRDDQMRYMGLYLSRYGQSPLL